MCRRLNRQRMRAVCGNYSLFAAPAVIEGSPHTVVPHIEAARPLPPLAAQFSFDAPVAKGVEPRQDATPLSPAEDGQSLFSSPVRVFTKQVPGTALDGALSPETAVPAFSFSAPTRDLPTGEKTTALGIMMSSSPAAMAFREKSSKAKTPAPTARQAIPPHLVKYDFYQQPGKTLVISLSIHKVDEQTFTLLVDDAGTRLTLEFETTDKRFVQDSGGPVSNYNYTGAYRIEFPFSGKIVKETAVKTNCRVFMTKIELKLETESEKTWDVLLEKTAEQKIEPAIGGSDSSIGRAIDESSETDTTAAKTATSEKKKKSLPRKAMAADLEDYEETTSEPYDDSGGRKSPCFETLAMVGFPADGKAAPTPTGSRPISNSTVTLGEPDEHGRREGWICGRCFHRSPGNLNGWGWTACQVCGADAGAGPTTPAQSANKKKGTLQIDDAKAPAECVDGTAPTASEHTAGAADSKAKPLPGSRFSEFLASKIASQAHQSEPKMLEVVGSLTDTHIEDEQEWARQGHGPSLLMYAVGHLLSVNAPGVTEKVVSALLDRLHVAKTQLNIDVFSVVYNSYTGSGLTCLHYALHSPEFPLQILKRLLDAVQPKLLFGANWLPATRTSMVHAGLASVTSSDDREPLTPSTIAPANAWTNASQLWLGPPKFGSTQASIYLHGCGRLKLITRTTPHSADAVELVAHSTPDHTIYTWAPVERRWTSELHAEDPSLLQHQFDSCADATLLDLEQYGVVSSLGLDVSMLLVQQQHCNQTAASAEPPSTANALSYVLSAATETSTSALLELVERIRAADTQCATLAVSWKAILKQAFSQAHLPAVSDTVLERILDMCGAGCLRAILAPEPRGYSAVPTAVYGAVARRAWTQETARAAGSNLASQRVVNAALDNCEHILPGTIERVIEMAGTDTLIANMPGARTPLLGLLESTSIHDSVLRKMLHALGDTIDVVQRIDDSGMLPIHVALHNAYKIKATETKIDVFARLSRGLPPSVFLHKNPHKSVLATACQFYSHVPPATITGWIEACGAAKSEHANQTHDTRLESPSTHYGTTSFGWNVAHARSAHGKLCNNNRSLDGIAGFKPVLAARGFSAGQHQWTLRLSSPNTVFGIAREEAGRQDWLGPGQNGAVGAGLAWIYTTDDNTEAEQYDEHATFCVGDSVQYAPRLDTHGELEDARDSYVVKHVHRSCTSPVVPPHAYTITRVGIPAEEIEVDASDLKRRRTCSTDGLSGGGHVCRLDDFDIPATVTVFLDCDKGVLTIKRVDVPDAAYATFSNLPTNTPLYPVVACNDGHSSAVEVSSTPDVVANARIVASPLSTLPLKSELQILTHASYTAGSRVTIKSHTQAAVVRGGFGLAAGGQPGQPGCRNIVVVDKHGTECGIADSQRGIAVDVPEHLAAIVDLQRGIANITVSSGADGITGGRRPEFKHVLLQGTTTGAHWEFNEPIVLPSTPGNHTRGDTRGHSVLIELSQGFVLKTLQLHCHSKKEASDASMGSSTAETAKCGINVWGGSDPSSLTLLHQLSRLPITALSTASDVSRNAMQTREVLKAPLKQFYRYVEFVFI